MIADQKIVFHGRCGYLERLNDECRPEQRQNHRDDQGLKILASR